MRSGRVHRMMWTLLLLASTWLALANPVQAQNLAPAPDVTAKSVYVFDATANTELMAVNSDEQRAPASTVKIVTIMVVLDNIDDVNQQVVVDGQDVTDPNSGESSMLLAA